MQTRLDHTVIRRIQGRVTSLLADEGLSAAVFDDPEDVAYMTGFFHHACERPVAVWVDQDRVVLLVPALEQENAERQRVAAEVVSYSEFPGRVSPWQILFDAANARAHPVIGVGPQCRIDRWDTLRALLPATTPRLTRAVLSCRQRKEPEEIALHQEAARIADLMIATAIASIRAAVAGGHQLPTEADLARMVADVGTRTMYAEHDEVIVVSPLAGGLVYAGANSAFPHGLPSSYRLRSGEPFMLSLGCAVGGRYVECERTFILGKPTTVQRRMYEAIHDAQAAGSAAIAPGVRCSETNQRCLAVIHERGLGKYLRHRQGHGIGLGMHEPPWLADGDDTVLASGMLVSNEPGIYVRGQGGYRISDSVLVTGTGSTSLTHYPRDLASCLIE